MKILFVFILAVICTGIFSCGKTVNTKQLTAIKATADSIAAIQIDSVMTVINNNCNQRMNTEVPRLADSIVNAQKNIR